MIGWTHFSNGCDGSFGGDRDDPNKTNYHACVSGDVLPPPMALKRAGLCSPIGQCCILFVKKPDICSTKICLYIIFFICCLMDINALLELQLYSADITLCTLLPFSWHCLGSSPGRVSFETDLWPVHCFYEIFGILRFPFGSSNSKMLLILLYFVSQVNAKVEIDRWNHLLDLDCVC